jgi:CRP-like cAMP-binding protein
MQDISSKSAGLNSTIEYLSLKTVKQKIAYYLLSMREEQQRIILDRSLTAFAAKMGSSREAVSRALSDMHNVGIIIKDRNAVKITDKSALEELLFE